MVFFRCPGEVGDAIVFYVECDGLGHAEKGQIAGHRAGIRTGFGDIGGLERDLRERACIVIVRALADFFVERVVRAVGVTGFEVTRVICFDRCRVDCGRQGCGRRIIGIEIQRGVEFRETGCVVRQTHVLHAPGERCMCGVELVGGRFAVFHFGSGCLGWRSGWCRFDGSGGRCFSRFGWGRGWAAARNKRDGGYGG